MRPRATRLRAAVDKLTAGEGGAFFRLTPGGSGMITALRELAGWVGEVEERLEIMQEILATDAMAAELLKLQRVIDVARELGQLAPPITNRPGGPLPGDLEEVPPL